jgi:hypothetical protein
MSALIFKISTELNISDMQDYWFHNREERISLLDRYSPAIFSRDRSGRTGFVSVENLRVWRSDRRSIALKFSQVS